MITTLTDTIGAIQGENMRPVTLVVVEEVKSGDWAVGEILPLKPTAARPALGLLLQR